MALLSSLAARLSRRAASIISLLLALLSTYAVIVLYYDQNPFLEAFEDKSYDLRFKNIRGAITPSDKIVIVAIDDKSIAELGRFPWSRQHYVSLIEQLSAAGVTAILFDAFFPEPEGDAVDKAFARAIREAGNVVLAIGLEQDAHHKVIKSTRSLPLLEAGALDTAHIKISPDEDGVNRRNLLLIEEQGKPVASLGLRGAMLAMGVESIDALSQGAYAIELGGHAIPVDANSAMWINYVGPAGVYPRYAFSDVVNGRIAPELLKDKLVFVGATALGIYDMRVTPYHSNTPGVEMHAAVADNIITGRFIQRTGIETVIDIAVIVLIGLLTFFLTARLQLYIAMPLALALSAGYIWLACEFFIAGQWLSIIYPLLSVVISLLVGGSYRYLILERSAREMRSMFSSYLSPKLVSRLEREPEAAQIGGDSKDVTIIFTDIKGFTSFTESRTPLEVVTRLNEYLDAMVRVVTQYDGTVDKFIGDGIMIYWGAPLAQPDHAVCAINALFGMKQALNELQVKWQREGEVPFAYRAGVNSGEVIAGNIGSHGKKMEYTVIGDTVNLAARLESTAKYYGIDILVADNTYQLSKQSFVYRELDLIRVVGKQIPVTVYEPIDPLSPFSEEDVEQFHAALKCYRARDWQQALALFQSISELQPDDKPCQIYIERCEYFISTPPAEEWDGVFNRRSK